MSAREDFEDERLVRLQDRLLKLEKQAALNPFFLGNKVANQALTTAVASVSHGLGRTPTGVVVIKVTPDAAIGFSTVQPTTNTDKFVNIEASATCTADLWFY